MLLPIVEDKDDGAIFTSVDGCTWGNIVWFVVGFVLCVAWPKSDESSKRAKDD